MKIVVFSDSHGTVSSMVDAVEREAPDRVLHLGDCWRDGERLGMACPGMPILQVPGNCDYQPGVELELLVGLGEQIVFLCHGHTRRVKQGYGGVIAEGKRLGANLVLFGHTHQPYLEEHQGMWIMNPGSISRHGSSTYGIIELSSGKIHCQLHKWE